MCLCHLAWFIEKERERMSVRHFNRVKKRREEQHIFLFFFFLASYTLEVSQKERMIIIP
jgi:hypothetical protein